MTKGEILRDEAIEHFRNRAKAKYDAGQEQHGGFLKDRVDWKDLEDESIDFMFYLYALMNKKEEEILQLKNKIKSLESRMLEIDSR